jgi:hypothetical protein
LVASPVICEKSFSPFEELSFFSSIVSPKIFFFLEGLLPPSNFALKSEILFPKFSNDFHASNKLLFIEFSSIMK